MPELFRDAGREIAIAAHIKIAPLEDFATFGANNGKFAAARVGRAV